MIRLGDARDLPYRSNYFGLILTSPPWDHLEVLEQATPELRRVLKKRGRWAVVMPHPTDPHAASLVMADRDRTWARAVTVPKPSRRIGPRYHSLDEELVHRVLDLHPWVRTVLDPFCGVGTVVKVATERGLEAHGVDNDPEVLDIHNQ